MSAAVFPLRIITPLAVLDREVRSLRLRDRTGYFGIQRGHGDFLTLLVPALGSYRTREGGEVFLAVEGGLLRVEGGRATLASQEVFEGPDAGALARSIDETRGRRRETERIYSRMVEGLEREFMEKTLVFLRGGAGA